MENEQIISIVSGLPYPCVAISMRDFERILCANPEAKVFLGDGIEGRHFYTVFRQPTMIEAIEGAIKSGERQNARVTISKNRRDAFYDATCINIAGQYCLVTFQDRTDQEQIQQMRRDFVANVSHELKSPLAALMGFIETLRTVAKDDPKAQERFLGIMESEAQRMNRLVNDLLSLSEVEATERQRPTENIDLHGLIEQTVDILLPAATARDVTLNVVNQTNTDITVKGDSDQLHQVFNNLIENAIKYGAKEGNVTVTLSQPTYLPALRSEGIEVTVSDDGPGIDPVHLPRLAERFYRIDSHRSRQMGGTGLGLAIVKHIISRHRGRLMVDSVMGQGSNFRVLLPYDISILAQSNDVS
jgi:two-component system phosphate regulon sensor histidine kinase PhoR